MEFAECTYLLGIEVRADLLTRAPGSFRAVDRPREDIHRAEAPLALACLPLARHCLSYSLEDACLDDRSRQFRAHRTMAEEDGLHQAIGAEVRDCARDAAG